ncbi:PQ-loop domain-containing transporter [Bacteriovoracales bacterium]|nr:PQ-loop domain-containing transporter [Bacteriovoracales bacterium]
MNFLNLIEFAYALFGSLMVAFYMPQIILVTKAKHELKEVSLLTYACWTIGLFIYFLYGLYKVGDLKLSILSLLSSINCATIFFITLYKRKKFGPRLKKQATNILKINSLNRALETRSS